MRLAAKLAAVFGVVALSVQANAGLVAHYTFENDSTQDVTGHGHNGAIIGGVTFGAGINGGTAAQFDGTGTIRVEDDAAIRLVGTSYTIALWVKTNHVGAQGFISGSENQGDFYGGYALGYRNNTVFSFHNDGTIGGQNHDFNASATNVNDTLGDWVHYTLVYDTDANMRSLYVNGVFADSVATPNDLVDRLAVTGGTRPLFLGALPHPDNYNILHMTGALDDVRIYNHALSASEIEGVVAAVPEPSSLALAGVGLMGLLARRRAAR